MERFLTFVVDFFAVIGVTVFLLVLYITVRIGLKRRALNKKKQSALQKLDGCEKLFDESRQISLELYRITSASGYDPLKLSDEEKRLKDRKAEIDREVKSAIREAFDTVLMD